MRPTHSDACHHCSASTLTDFSDGYALVVTAPPTERSNDDGEPSSTARQSVLDVLRGTGLTNTTVVVIRYFGRTLLGIGGLVRTYSEVTVQALQATVRVTLTRFHLWDLRVPVVQTGKIEAELRSRNLAAASGPTAEDGTVVLALTIHVEETIWGSTRAVLMLTTSCADSDLLHIPLAALTRGEGAAEPVGGRLAEVPVPPAWSPESSSSVPLDALTRHPRARIVLATTM